MVNSKSNISFATGSAGRSIFSRSIVGALQDQYTVLAKSNSYSISEQLGAADLG